MGAHGHACAMHMHMHMYIRIYIVILYNAALFSGSKNNYRVVMILTIWDVVTSSETVGFC